VSIGLGGGGGEGGMRGCYGATVGCAGDTGAHHGAWWGDRAGGRRHALQREDDVGGRGNNSKHNEEHNMHIYLRQGKNFMLDVGVCT
jgi:hypothetical protein